MRTSGGELLAWVDPPLPRPTLPDALRASLSVEAASAFDAAIRDNRLTYSRPYFVQFGETGFDLFELVVPTGKENAPLIIAVYAPQRILDYFIPVEMPPNQLYSLTEADGTVVARQPSMGQSRRPLWASSPLAQAGNSLHLRVDAMRSDASLIPNLMTALVALVSVALGVAIFFLVRDVTRRATAESALREQIGFRHAIEEAMIDALAVQNMDGRLVHVNSTLCRLTGFARPALIGRRRPPFATGKLVRDHAAFRRAREVGDTDARSFQTVLRRADGGRFPAMISETPMFDGTGHQTGWLLLATDLTEQQRVEEVNRRQTEVLQSRSRLATLGEMASTLSHELNQPLAAITSYAAACENLMNNAPQRPEPVRQALRGIKGQAERAGQVIRSVHAFLRRRQIERSDCNLLALVNGLAPLINLQATRTGARFEPSIAPSLTVHADRVMLEQVLLNLTRNGFEAMADIPPRDRVLELLAKPIAQDERGGRIEVSVVDRGRGVPPDVVPNLFSAFFTTKSEGMGLGLSLCRSVIEQHAGQMIYRPRPGGGSIFSFDLPTAAADGNETSTDTQEETRQ